MNLTILQPESIRLHRLEVPFIGTSHKFAVGIDRVGKMSTFGGPGDTGVSPSEGLALIESSDLKDWWFRYLFLRTQPPQTSGLARRLDPDAYYIAMRWNYDGSTSGADPNLPHTSRDWLRHNYVMVSAHGITVKCRPADWGPNVNTGRVADVSPGVASVLNIKTDDIVTIDIPSP